MALLTAFRFDGVTVGDFGGLNNLAKVGELRLQGLDRFGNLNRFSTCFGSNVLTHSAFYCTLCLTHANLLVSIPLT